MSENILSDRYQLVETIGNGGMATVYRANDLSYNQWVAIKIMNPQLSHDQHFIERFSWEAKATGKLSHPNIVKLYDTGNDNQMYYMVMEYVNGITLKEMIQNKGPLPIDQAITITTQICDALDHAHNKGIIHRDIKPQNIMCSHTGQYKVTDFGISRFANGSSNLTKTGTVLGSVHYFSPEQAQGKTIDPTSDLYSLGIVLYEMVTGVLPFDAPEHVAIALMHIQNEVPNPQKLNPKISQSLRLVIDKALAKKPEDRYASVSALKEALLLLQQKPVYRVSAKTVPTKPTPSLEPRQVRFKNNKKVAKRWLKPLIITSIIFIMIFVGYSYAEGTFLSNNQSHSPSTSPTTKKQEVKPAELEPSDTNVPSTAQETADSITKEQQTKSTAPFIVVVGSFSKKENAQRFAEQLKKNQINVTITQSKVFNQKLYRVHSPEFNTRQQAKEQLTIIRQANIDGAEKAFIIQIDSKKEKRTDS